MRRVLLSGGVFRSTAIGDFEAEGVGNIYLSSDKRGDMFCLVGVFHTSDRSHLVASRHSSLYWLSTLMFTVSAWIFNTLSY